LRERYEEFRGKGSEVVAIGTGDVRYAEDFVASENIPFPVLVDDDGAAARAAAVQVSSFIGLFHPRTWGPTRDTMRRGYGVHKAGKRVTQLGASFVISPGPSLVYEHIDRDSTDHAPIDELLAAIPQPG
jgi:peroxiredoxin